MTKLTLTNCYGRYEIEINKDDMTLDEMANEIIRPILILTGYNKDQINEYINEIKETGV